MRSIERRFILEQEKSHLSSDFICFSAAVYKQGFTMKMITEWFNKLVDEKDYDKKEKGELLEFLESHSNS